jgi:NADH-quinone oxidoreductase subunit L
LIFLTFHGAPRWSHSPHVSHDHGDDHHDDHGGDGHALEPHESPKVMLIPMEILTVGALFAGVAFAYLFIGSNSDGFWRGVLGAGPDNHVLHLMHDVPGWVQMISFWMMAIGFIAAVICYIWRPELPAKIAANNPGLYKFLLNKWYFDELYNFLFVQPAFKLGRLFWRVDRDVIDRYGPDGLAAAASRASTRVSRFETGYIYQYAFAMLIGVAGFLTWYLLGSAR